MFHGSVLIGCWILHELGLLGAGPDSWGLLLFAVQGSVRQVLLADLAAPGPAGGLSFFVGAAWLAGAYCVLRSCLVALAAAELLLVAGLALLRFVGLSALLLGCSGVGDGALLGWAPCLHTHSLADQALPR